MCGGFILGLSRSHFASHVAVKEPCVLPCVCSRCIRRARHFAATCVSSQPPCFFRLTNVDNGTRKVSTRHIYHDTAIFMRFILSLGGRTWTVYHALDNKYICTYCSRWCKVRSLPYVSLAWARMLAVTFAQITAADWQMLMDMYTPSIRSCVC